MVVVTRDTFGIAMKATYGEVNGRPIMIYKDPKTDLLEVDLDLNIVCSLIIQLAL